MSEATPLSLDAPRRSLPDARVRSEPVADVAGRLAVIAALSYPRLADDVRQDLVTFAMAVRRLSRESGEAVSGAQLARAGYGATQVARPMPRAQEILGVLDLQEIAA